MSFRSRGHGRGILLCALSARCPWLPRGGVRRKENQSEVPLPRPRDRNDSVRGRLAPPWLLAGSLIFLIIGLTGVPSRTQVLDRVVASIGDVAITQSDVEHEYRLERFLDGQWPPPAPDSKTLKQACERLVYQKVLLEEETQDLSHDPDLEKAAAEESDAVRKRFPSDSDYQSALQSLHMDEKQILAALIDQQRILRIIEERLRPSAAPATPEIESYYHDVFTPEYTRTHGPPVPPLAKVEGQIQEILVQKKIDQLLATWLEELGPSHRVHFYPVTSDPPRRDE